MSSTASDQISEAEPSSGSASPAIGSPPASRFPVVGIGASAGGLDAFKQLLLHLPATTGMAFIFVQHLDPKHESILPDLLAEATSMPVHRALDGMPLNPNHVYVIPPNSIVTVVGGNLSLTPRPDSHRLFMPVDYLLRSLANDLGLRSIGVILSGGGTDGTLGIQAIKAAEGITFAQTEETAAHDSMPRCAILSGSIDYVLSPAGIADELNRIGRHPYLDLSAQVRGVKQAEAVDERELRKLFSLIQSHTGVDFSGYKRNTILRRVIRRMTIRRLDSVPDYVRLLETDPDERTALYQDLLIRVTSFFRDPESFRALEQKVLSILARDQSADSPIRIWVAGCSTGEEVYSIAISLIESLGDHGRTASIKILATDINHQALDVARAGFYIDNIAQDVSPERLRRFFAQVEGGYLISKIVREMCIFSRHDVTRDPPFARLDLISCRNLLIYFDLGMQKRVFPLFHYALRPGGYLMLGPSETIGASGELFAPVDAEHKIFAKKVTATRPYFDFTIGASSIHTQSVQTEVRNKSEPEPVSFDLKRETERILLARYTPPGVLIDEDLRIIQFRGQTDPYLAPAAGAASFDLIKMAREGLAKDLRLAITQAKSERSPVRRNATFKDPGGQMLSVEIEVIALRLTQSTPSYYLVLFQRPQSPSPERPIAAVSSSEIQSLGLEDARNQVAVVRNELETAREYLQSITEEHEATTEELRSANEEILSSNEELQSTNEELQTAKEEMQSANEELRTVNDELNNRNTELARANDDLVNLFAGVNIPIVMVNRELRIRRYTAPAEQLLNVISTDVGRHIGDIRSRLDFPDLDHHIVEVIASLVPQDHEARDRDGKWYSVRIRPYITVENKIDGALVAVVDIDQIKNASEQVKRARDRAEAIVETVQEPLAVLDDELRAIRANPAFYRMFGTTREKAEGRLLSEVGVGPWADPNLVGLLHDVRISGRKLHDLEVDINTESASARSFRVAACPIDWDESDSPKVLLAFDDVTDRRRDLERTRSLLIEQTARAEAERSNRRKDEFLAMLAHELRNPLSPIMNSLMVLRSPGASASDIAWTSDIMERQVRHMSRLVDDLLDVSRIIRGVVRLRRETIELAPIFERVLDVVRPLVQKRRQELIIDLPAEPIFLDADPVRMEQVMTNLLNNAAKFTQEGGKVWLTAGREGSDILVRVKDNGIGIPRELLREVFDLFMQVDSSLERSLGGLGIGLTLAKSLVELQGGSIEAHSEGIGQGSEFIVRLPTSSRGVLSREGFASPADIPSRRVLIVDDNADAARTLAILVKHYGHEVQTASDGASALEAAHIFKPVIIFLDIGMPGMNGYELARRLRADPATKEVVLVALTGYGQEEDRRRSLEAGFDDHAIKPVDLERLTQILGTVRS